LAHPLRVALPPLPQPPLPPHTFTPSTNTHHFMPPAARAILEAWYAGNKPCPYPDDALAQELAQRCREPVRRVLRWLSNRRSADRNTKGSVGRRKRDGYAKHGPKSPQK
jgi:hypothetical protein